MCEFCNNEADRLVSPNSRKDFFKIKMCKECYERTQAKQQDRKIKFVMIHEVE